MIRSDNALTELAGILSVMKDWQDSPSTALTGTVVAVDEANGTCDVIPGAEEAGIEKTVYENVDLGCFADGSKGSYKVPKIGTRCTLLEVDESDENRMVIDCEESAKVIDINQDGVKIVTDLLDKKRTLDGVTLEINGNTDAAVLANLLIVALTTINQRIDALEQFSVAHTHMVASIGSPTATGLPSVTPNPQTITTDDIASKTVKIGK